jgi:4-hydroxybenzoate polyprenyltransferase
MPDLARAAERGPARSRVLRYLSCLRPQDVLALQGSPLLGAVFAMGRPSIGDLGPLLILLLANVLLIAHIFMLNDWSGLAADRADPNKTSRVFTARGVGRTEMAALTAALLVLSLLLFARLSLEAFGLACAIAILSGIYSLPRFHWKGRPILSSVIHFGGGMLHVLVGSSIAHRIDGRDLAIATFFALLFTAGHLTQEIRDHHGDTLNGIRTNAVAFGPRRVFVASLLLFALAQLTLLVLARRGLLPPILAALTALFPLQLYWSLEALREKLTYASVSRLQTRYRALYAVIGVVMVGAVLWR